jgi:signal transduction histidine kinase
MRGIIILLFLLCVCSANANIDSLKQAYKQEQELPIKLDLGLQLLKQLKAEAKLDSSLIIGDQVLNIARRIGSDLQVANILEEIANTYERQGKLDLADSLLDLTFKLSIPDSLKANNYIQKYSIATRKGLMEEEFSNLTKARKLIANDTLGSIMGAYYCYLAIYQTHKREFLDAISLLRKGKAIISEDDPNYPRFNYNLTRIYERIGLYEEAKSIFQETYDLAKKSDDYRSQLFAIYGIASMNLNLKDYQAVKAICDKAFEIKEQHGISLFFGYNHILLGSAFLEEEKLDSAMLTIREGIAISEIQQEESEALLCKFILAQVFQKMGQLDSAYYYIKQTEPVLSRFDAKDKQKLAKIYADVGNFESAYQFILDAQQLELKKANDINQTISALIDDKYEQEKIKTELRYQQEFRKQQTTMMVIVGILCLLGLFLYTLSQRANNKELKRLNDSLSKRNEALKQFAYITSHDLKEPVRNIASFTQVLLQNLEKGDAANQKKYLDFINNSSKTLHEIVNSIQTFTNVQFKKIVKEEVDLEDTFQKLSQTFALKLAEQNAQLTFENLSNIKQIEFSKAMLLLVLQNLIQNGLKFNESDQPEVTVSVKKNGEKTLFSVQDNGIGIPEKYHESIFEPFKTLANKTITASSGLGLSICKNIIENYGGRIWIEKAEGNGSKFSFEI